MTLDSLRGEPVVVAMAYTSCKDICPMIVADIVAIEDRIKESSPTKIRFAFFWIISTVDTPERLGLMPKTTASTRRIGRSITATKRRCVNSPRRSVCAIDATPAGDSITPRSFHFSMLIEVSSFNNLMRRSRQRKW